MAEGTTTIDHHSETSKQSSEAEAHRIVGRITDIAAQHGYTIDEVTINSMKIYVKRTIPFDVSSDISDTYRELLVCISAGETSNSQIKSANAKILIQNTGEGSGQYHFSDEEIFTAIEPALKRLSGSTINEN